MIGIRLMQARRAAGMSLRELAARSGISAMAISKYERDLMAPGPGALEGLARALSVRADFFSIPLKVAIPASSLRMEGGVPVHERERLRFAVQESLERMLDLEHLFGMSRQALFRVSPAVTREISRPEEVEERADHLRAHWDLGSSPLPPVAGLLEEHGVKVFLLSMPEGPDSFSCRARGTWAGTREAPVIACRRGLPGEAQRFAMLCELGRQALTAGAGIDEEKACRRFAGALLAPREAALRELGPSRVQLSFYELTRLKKKYGLAIHEWLARAAELSIISRLTAAQLVTAMGKRGWRRREPAPLPPEEPHRYKVLLFQAVMEGMITRDEARRFLGIAPGSAAPPETGESEWAPEPGCEAFDAGGGPPFMVDDRGSEWAREEEAELFGEEEPFG